MSFHYYLHTLLTNLNDCHVAWLQGGVDGCRAILTDGRACLGAIDAIYADLLAIVAAMHLDSASLALYQHGIGRDVSHTIDDAFLNKHKVFPTVSRLILFDSTTWHIQRSIIKSIKRESSKIFRCFPINCKRILYQRNNSGDITTIERLRINARYAVGDGDGGQARAAKESIIANTRHAVGDGDGGQARTTIESIITNTRHAVGDGDGGQARAVTKSPFFNARNYLYL